MGATSSLPTLSDKLDPHPLPSNPLDTLPMPSEEFDTPHMPTVDLDPQPMPSNVSDLVPMPSGDLVPLPLTSDHFDPLVLIPDDHHGNALSFGPPAAATRPPQLWHMPTVRETNARQCECILNWVSRNLAWASGILYRTYKGHLSWGKWSRKTFSHTVPSSTAFTRNMPTPSPLVSKTWLVPVPTRSTYTCTTPCIAMDTPTVLAHTSHSIIN